MEDPWGDHAIAVKFDRIPESVAVLRGMSFNGVAAVGDAPAVLAAESAQALGIAFHSPEAARACHDKYLARARYRDAGMRVPRFFLLSSGGQPEFPCVLKPLGMSASRGVIRANDRGEFDAAVSRIHAMGSPEIQVESYIPGREFAVEGLVTRGRFQPLAIFDKPDPLEGPYFEEPIYVTPSREPAAVQAELLAETARAIAALGLSHGPVHAELRYNQQGAWVLEAHARPIGGLCARSLTFEGGVPLEEVILRHAVGEDVSGRSLEAGASGVMMIPIPRGGVYESVDGLDEALAVAGVEDVMITAQHKQRLIPLPEGSSYLGFIFARGASPTAVDESLRRSHAALRFRISTALDTFSPSS